MTVVASNHKFIKCSSEWIKDMEDYLMWKRRLIYRVYGDCSWHGFWEFIQLTVQQMAWSRWVHIKHSRVRMKVDRLWRWHRLSTVHCYVIWHDMSGEIICNHGKWKLRDIHWNSRGCSCLNGHWLHWIAEWANNQHLRGVWRPHLTGVHSWNSGPLYRSFLGSLIRSLTFESLRLGLKSQSHLSVGVDMTHIAMMWQCPWIGKRVGTGFPTSE